jgi:hypothetical protein
MLMRPRHSLDRLLTLKASGVQDLRDSITVQPAEEMRDERWDPGARPVTRFLPLRYRLQGFKVRADILNQYRMIIVISCGLAL